MKIFFVRHAITQNNIDGTPYINNDHPITKHGELQAKDTGKYLKTFGKFDLIISSSRLRTIMTAECIAKELNYKKDIVLDELLSEEISELYKDNIELLSSSKKVIEITINNASKLQMSQYEKYKKLIKNTTDPFEKLKLEKKQYDLIQLVSIRPSYEHRLKKANKFLNKLKSLNYKNVLVVTHSTEIKVFQSIISNTNFYIDNKILYTHNNNNKILSNEISYYGNYNCCILGVLFEKDIKKFTIVIPTNILHLVKLIPLHPESYKLN